jgi:membrane protein insertase Oxa1/YidC/SpoIIIJ
MDETMLDSQGGIAHERSIHRGGSLKVVNERPQMKRMMNILPLLFLRLFSIKNKVA